MTTDRERLPYRPCVGMMVLNRDGRVFTGRRMDTMVEAWQMPQGGVDPGEDYAEAALRELNEEIGTAKVAILDRTDAPIAYDLPDHLLGKVWRGRYRGQIMHWFAMRFTGSDADIDIATAHPEFEAWRWTPIDDLPKLIVPFKRQVYEQVIDRFRHLAMASDR